MIVKWFGVAHTHNDQSNGDKSMKISRVTRSNMKHHQGMNFIPSRDRCWLENLISTHLEASPLGSTRTYLLQRALKAL